MYNPVFRPGLSTILAVKSWPTARIVHLQSWLTILALARIVDQESVPARILTRIVGQDYTDQDFMGVVPDCLLVLVTTRISMLCFVLSD